MIKCHYCRAEMEKTYSFSSREGTVSFRCPDCGASTKAKPIAYGEDGFISERKKKNTSRGEESVTAQAAFKADAA